MDYITGIQRAIDYIEDHICDELNYDDIADKAACSSFYFQRIFGILCGVPLGEYIRNRRLTLAGSELINTDAKIIDIAFKYGYESPESFTRAFSKFHGITPSDARKDSNKLKSFSRLSVHIIMKGGSIMNYKIIEKPRFKVLEKVETQSVRDEENKNSIPEFWTRCHNDGTVKFLSGIASDNKFIFGICYGNTQKDSDTFDYAIGAVCDENCTAPDGFRISEIPARTWAMFECVGAMPNAMQDTWHKICTGFFPTAGYAPTQEMDIEAYSNGDMSSADYKSEIWVPIKR